MEYVKENKQFNLDKILKKRQHDGEKSQFMNLHLLISLIPN